MPKVKVYEPADSRDGFLSREVCDLLGLPSHVQQGAYAASAYVKAEAVGYVGKAGLGFGVPRLRVAMGNDVDALAESGLFAKPGVVLAWAKHGHGRRDVIARIAPGGAASIAGWFTTDPVTNKPTVTVKEG